MLKYKGDLKELKNYGFERKLYQGSYYLIKEIHINYNTNYQNTTDIKIFIGLNKRKIDFGWGKSNFVEFTKGDVAIEKTDLNMYDGYAYGKLCEDEKDILSVIDDVLDLIDDKDGIYAGKLYELDCSIKKLVKDGLFIKE